MDYSPEFREVLDYIYSFTMNGRKNRKKDEVSRPPTLAIMEAFMEFMGQPQKKFQVIHIAGTKGKGSTANFIAGALISSGYTVGLFTSPHLFDFSERIQVNGSLIPHEQVIRVVEMMKPFFETHPEVNTFEIITAIAFDFFRNQQVDFAVVEVGLGGRFDATNVVDPLLSVITSISYDHMDLLGDTLEQISFEKAGIIKDKVPVVVGVQAEPAAGVLKEVAIQKNAPYIQAIPLSKVVTRNIERGHWIRIEESGGGDLEFVIPLFGFHQIENALLAYSTIQELNKRGILVPPEAIKDGFGAVHWPARFQILSTNPLIIIDGAHNADSVRRILETMQLIYPERRIHVVFGVSTGKDLDGMLGQLLPVARSCIFTQSSHPKSLNPTALVQLAHQLGFFTISTSTVEEAIQRALQELQDTDVLLCTGSLFLAAAVSDVWKSMNYEMKE